MAGGLLDSLECDIRLTTLTFSGVWDKEWKGSALGCQNNRKATNPSRALDEVPQLSGSGRNRGVCSHLEGGVSGLLC